jgi:CheY-like chemotaxis protein
MTDSSHKKRGSRIPKYSRLLAGFGSKFNILFLPSCWHKDTRRFTLGALPGVLVIEETPGEQKKLLDCLANGELSAQISVFNGGQAAFDFLLDHASHNEPFLLIVDAGAQFENGFGLVEKIRANEFLRDIPISIVGAQANEDHLASAIDLNAVSYILKPTSDDQNTKLAKVFKELFSSLVRPAQVTETST